MHVYLNPFIMDETIIKQSVSNEHSHPTKYLTAADD